MIRSFVVLSLMSTVALAQQPRTPPADIEPAVNTSAPTPAASSAAPAAAPAATAAPTAVRPTPAADKSPAPARAGAARPTARGMDRLELEATQITGNRELPRVMYVVPWRRADLGDLTGRPANSLLDEALTPVDRDVFRRQSQYYEALQPDQPAAAR